MIQPQVFTTKTYIFRFFFGKIFDLYGETEMPRKKSIEDIANDMKSLARADDNVFNDPIFVKASERKEVTSAVLVDGQTVERTTIKRDPLQLKVRLYAQVGELLHQLEGATDEPITVRERIAALVAIGRLQDLLIEKGKDDDDNAGSAIRKYASAFTKNGAGRRKKTAGSRNELLLESDSGGGDGLDGDDELDAGE